MWSAHSVISVILMYTLYGTLYTPVNCDLSYGEKCEYNNTTVVCNSGLSLYCSGTEKKMEGVCRCPDTMYWDISRSRVGGKCPGSCVSMVGQNCNSKPRDGTEKGIECVANAVCRYDKESRTNKCFCRLGFQASPEGDCLLSFGNRCSDDMLCNYASFLTCSSNQTCVCDKEDPAVQMWDKDHNECVSLVGGDCQSHEPDVRSCIRNAVCNEHSVCECAQNYTLNKDNNNCVVPFGGPCEQTVDCGPTLTCQPIPPEPTTSPTTTTTIPTPTTKTTVPTPAPTPATTKKSMVKSVNRFVNAQKRIPSPNNFLKYSTPTPPSSSPPGRCGCNDTSEHFDEASQKCQILVGHTCQNGKECIHNAECSRDRENNYNQCVCSKLFVHTDDHTCAGDYGATCHNDEHNMDCFTDGYLTCDKNSSSCVCMDAYEYEPKLKKCIGFVGSKCTSNDFCNVTTSICANGACTCSPGYSPFPSSNNTSSYQYCLASSGTNCSTEVKCNGDEFLNCVQGMCQCEQLAYFDLPTHQCIGLVGGNCSDPIGLSCVQHASCVASKDNSETKLCSCDLGFRDTDEHRCKPNGAGSHQFDKIFMILTLIASFVKASQI